MITVSIHYQDSFNYDVELKPEIWESAHREVSLEELEMLQRYEVSYDAFQSMLKMIHARPEINAFTGKMSEL